MQIRWIWWIAILATFSHCGKTRGKDNKNTVPSQRNGRSLSKVEIKYVDQAPSVSADGTKLVFVSGKDSTVLRVRKASRSAGAAFSDTSKATENSGLTTETAASVSPDGNYILIQGTSGSSSSLVLCSWDGTSCSSLTTELWGQGQFGFSPESSAFFYLKASASSAAASLTVASVSSPTSAVTIGSELSFYQALWVPVGSGFKILGSEKSDDLSSMNIKLYSFADVAAASSVAATTILSSETVNSSLAKALLGGSSGTTAASSMLLTRELKQSTELTVNEQGNVAYSSTNVQRKIPLQNQTNVISFSGGSSATVPTAGYQTVSAILASDGVTVFSLNHIAGRCNAEETLTYGPVLTLSSLSDASVSYKYLKTPIDLSQPPVTAEGFCDLSISGTATTLEFGLFEFVVNAAATASTYTAAWTSNMSGDPEVFAMDVSGTATTIWNVSQNKKP